MTLDKKILAASIASLLSFAIYADELDGLSDPVETASSAQTTDSDSLQQLSGDELDSVSDVLTPDSIDSSEESSLASNSIQFSGYLKPLTYWGSREFSNATWERLTDLQADGITIPQPREYSGFAATGARFQFRLEGYAGQHARLFSAVNLDYNEAGTSAQTRTRLVEAYIELFDENATWKIGNQLVTWGFMEGVEVPTDRVNAFDYAYSSTEYEDAKMASTGILYQRSLGQFSGLDLLVIPVGKVNNDSPDQDRLFSQQSSILLTRDSSNVKTALRYYFNHGNLDVALSYVNGPGRKANVALLGTSPNQSLQRQYRKESSPGIDLQYNFGSVLGKIAYAEHHTDDSEGDDPAIKNSWKHLAFGAEFNIGASIANLYAGTKRVDNFNNSTDDYKTTNVLMGQSYAQINFISGHVTSNFLTGNALSTTLLFAGYWNNKGDIVQYIIKPSLTYKMADALQLQFSPTLMNADDTVYQSIQFEAKYSF